MVEELKEYLLSFGFSYDDISKLLQKMTTRNVETIKKKIEDYKNLLQINDNKVRKIILAIPTLLNHDTSSDNETSVKRKIQAYKDLLKLSDVETRKMIVSFPALLDFDTNSNSITSVRGKIKAYKSLLNLSDSEVKKMIVFSPALLGNDINGKNETSVKYKLKTFKNLFKLSDSEVRKMIITSPILLGLDTNGNSETSVKGKIKAYKKLLKLNNDEVKKMIVSLPTLLSLDLNGSGNTSVKTKIEKIKQMIPFETFRKIAIEHPNVFNAPAQSFKIRFMIANVLQNSQAFFSGGFLTNEKKIWARSCYLQNINSNTKGYLYTSEKMFCSRFGISSSELIEKYPLDEFSIEKIENTYFEKTGKLMTLDNLELEQLGLKR